MGQVTHLSGEIGAVRKREFRRMLVFSLLAHGMLVVALTWQPIVPAMTLPGVVAVELVAAPPSAVPAPAPAPPKPISKKVVLPKEPTAPKPKPKPAEKKLEPPPQPVERDLDDVLADLRSDAGETTPEPIAQVPAAAPSAGIAGAVGVPVSPEVAAWIKKAKVHVRQAWVLPPAFRTQALQAHVVVELDAQGNVMGEPRIVRRSGNPWFDEGVVRAIQKSSPLPPPPAADEWSFVFVPGDSY